MDTVVGSRAKGVCLLVLTERLSRKEIILKLKDKTSQSVIKSLQYLKKQMSRKALNQFKTITTDNGSEFMNAEAIETELGVKMFYAHSYCSWERGSNENNNKWIRRFLPKGKSLDKVTTKELKRIENWMNNMPRKIFNGKTANEIYQENVS